jgi:hypothetical protein
MPDAIPSKYAPVLYNIQKDIGIRRENGAKNLQKLMPVHKKMIAMHLSGMPTPEIAHVLKTHYSTVFRVLNDPLAQEFINGFNDMARKELESLRSKYNGTIRDGLNHTDMGVRLRSANLFAKGVGDYDRKPGQDDETAEDIAQRILVIAGQVQING